MHLSYKTSQYQGKIYKSYFIAESYREGKKVKKRTILSLGKLADEKAQQIRFICKAISEPSAIVTKIENIVVEKSKPFLDLAVADALWEEWKMSRAFKSHETNSELPTTIIAKILTINRCTSPCSHYSVPQWANKTALPEILGFPLDKLNEDKIYYELDKIALSQKKIEDHLFQMTYSKNKSDYEFVNYDLSTSYFVGVKCKLSAYGRSKENKTKNKQVLLGIMVNGRGYPFKWDVYAGNPVLTGEIDTLVDNVDACRPEVSGFKLKKITLVFDRGLVSDENLDDIDGKGLKYVTALDKDQIYGVAEKELSPASGGDDLTSDNYKAHLLQKKFKYYDDSLLKEISVERTNKNGQKRMVKTFEVSLDKKLADRRREIEGIDYLNSKNLYEPFRSCHYVTVRDKVSKRKKSEPVELTVQQNPEVSGWRSSM